MTDERFLISSFGGEVSVALKGYCLQTRLNHATDERVGIYGDKGY
jgi:hypothetical protein